MYMVDMFTPTIAQLIEAGMMDEVALMGAFIECKGWINDLLRPELADIFTDSVTPSGIAVYRNNLQNDPSNRPTPPAASMSDTPDPISGTSANPIPDKLQSPKAQDLLQRANDAGLCTGRKWNDTKILLAYFTEKACAYLGIVGGEYNRHVSPQKSVATTKRSWQPFEVYFRVSGLAQTSQDYDICTGFLPNGHEKIDKLFET